MKIGIDGNMWCCSNGLSLGDPRAEFSFGRTLREAAAGFHSKFSCNDEVPEGLHAYLDITPEEFNRDSK